MFSAFKDTIKGALAFGVSSSLVTAVGFILTPLYTRCLSIEDFGIFGLVGLTMTVATAIFGMGLSPATFRSYYDYQEEEDRKRLIGTALFVAFIGCAVLLLLATLTAEPLIAGKLFRLPGRGRYFMLGLYASAVGLLNAVPLTVYRAKKLLGRFALVNGAVAFLQMVLIVVLVVFCHAGITGIVVGQLTALLFVDAVLLFSVRKDARLVVLWREVKKMLAYGLPLVPGSVFYLFLNSGSLYFAQAVMGLKEVAVLNLANKISSIFSVLVITPFQLIWIPMMFSVEKKDFAEKFYSRMLTYSVYASVCFALPISVFSHEIVRVLATPQYEGAGRLINLFLFGYILFVAQTVLNVGIILKRKTGYWSLAIFVETAFSLACWVLLAPRFGLMGIAVGSLGGYLSGVIITWLFSRQFLKISYEVRRVTVVLIIYPLSMIATSFIPSSLTVYSILLKCVVILLSLAIPLLFKMWHEDEIVTLKHCCQQMWLWKKNRFSPPKREQQS